MRDLTDLKDSCYFECLSKKKTERSLEEYESWL